MNQLPNQPSNIVNANEPFSQDPNVLNISEREVGSSNGAASSESVNMPPKEKTIKNLKRIYAILLVTGLIIGGVISVGIVTAINKQGLTDVPARVDEWGE